MHILFIDDEPYARKMISDHLESNLGHHVTQCGSAEKALEIFTQQRYPLVMTDIKMPGMNGIELLKKIKALPHGAQSDVILITAYGDMPTAIAALRAGAYDYLNKPIELEELSSIVNRVSEHQALIEENYELTLRFQEKVAEATKETESELKKLRKTVSEIVEIGQIGIFSQEMEKVVNMARKMHENKSLAVIIGGETGTGKEIVARMIHFGEGKVTDPFVAINCSAITPTLFESELFGYEGSAFSGAKRTGQKGKLELAREGSLFLDEIGDMPLEMQPKLLRVLQEREFYSVGGLKKIKFLARVICASNRDLKELVDNGLFRSDLYHRLNVGRIDIPPLRDRRNEIRPLADLFLHQIAEQRKSKFKSINEEALAILENYSWPGNVRELRNVIERVLIVNEDSEIKPEHLQFLIASGKENQQTEHANHKIKDYFSIQMPDDGLDLRFLEKEVIKKVLGKYNGNVTRSAAYLGISRMTLRKKLQSTP